MNVTDETATKELLVANNVTKVLRTTNMKRSRLERLRRMKEAQTDIKQAITNIENTCSRMYRNSDVDLDPYYSDVELMLSIVALRISQNMKRLRQLRDKHEDISRYGILADAVVERERVRGKSAGARVIIFPSQRTKNDSGVTLD